MRTLSLMLSLLLFPLFPAPITIPPAAAPQRPQFNRIVIDEDGNAHDRDDITAAGITNYIAQRTGIGAKVVLWVMNNEYWRNIPSQHQQMADSVTQGLARFAGMPNVTVVDGFNSHDPAVQLERTEINKSTQSDPLVILAMGPMQIIGEAIASSDSNARAHVTVISHSDWNNNHAKQAGPSEGLNPPYYSFSDFPGMGVQALRIKDQNAGLAKPYPQYFWLRDSADPNEQWIWSRGQVSNKNDFDCSDSGELYYLATGDDSATPTKLQALNGNPTPTPTGKADYLLYNASTRQTAIYYLNNNAYVSSAFGPTLPAGWTLIDAADYNGDGRPDYALFNPTTRQTAIWYLNNHTYVSGTFGPTLPAGWSLVAVGDFNRDGKPDYVLFNASTRQTAIWYLNNNAHVGGAFAPTLPAGWKVVGIGDFNRDGKPDYLLFNTSSRQSAIWYLNNSAYISGAFGPTIAAGYVLTGTADFNRDSQSDYTLFNSTTRQTAIWYLNNNTYVNGASGPTLPAGWSLVKP